MRKAISIVMPAYNVTPYIRVALDSVFAQTFRDFEVVVVNDGCPDTKNLERELDAFASRITYVKQENEGVGSARRTAVDATSAPLIAQLDPDDWWEPDYLEIQLKLMEACGADFIYPNGYYFGIPALEGKLLMDYTFSDGEVTFCNAMETKVNIIYSGLIKREAILHAGNFDPKFRTSEDFDLWMRMLKSGARITYHREPLLHYRLRQDSLTWGRLEAQTWLLQVLDKLETVLDLSAAERVSLEARRTAVQMEMELIRGKQAIQQRSWKDASWHLELYRNYRPSRKINLVLMMLRRCPWLVGTGLSARERFLRNGWLKAKRPQQALMS